MHLQAEIITAGTELLLGQITDTNTPWIARRLALIGIDLYYQATVGDNLVRMKKVLTTALQRSSLILITGGLGPTADDLTREVVAEVLDAPLQLHIPSLEEIEERFESFHRKMTQNNRKQAYLPTGAIPIKNSWGTAPGFMVKKGRHIVIALPGVPHEMKGMMEETVLPYLQDEVGGQGILYSRVLCIYGLGESQLETQLYHLLTTQTNPTLALLAKRGEVQIRLTVKAQNLDEACKALAPLEEQVQKQVGDYLYSGKGESMEEVVMRLLHEEQRTLSLAESITGGLISSRLTALPGASQILLGSWIPYTREAKILLGILEEDLQEGTVSARVTTAMARQVRQLTRSSIGAAVTGLAGPGKGEEEKPLGTVYVCISGQSFEETREAHFPGERDVIRERAALFLLDGIRRHLLL